ncbi:hypothetical protein [Streptomyces hygroscopicus]|uniref:hypothetical protein n=1 Tax=Streptomyces hygroscopicus TaxID=1912 RepID=UPI0004CC30C8|nr:hypothetical protein [Streptomyces hygroscopicus]
MIWWFKARRIVPVLLPCLAGFVVIVALFSGVTVDFPSLLTGGSNDFLIMLLAPVPATSGLLLCLTSRLVESEAARWRPVHHYDALLITATVAFAAAVGCVAGWASGSGDAWSLGRNTGFLTGLMLLVHTAAPQGAVAVPVGWVFTVVFVGFDRFHRPYPWTVLPQPPTEPLSLTTALAVFAVGLIAHATAHPRL